MKQVSTQAKVLTREEAIWRAAWALVQAREKLAELYGWALSGGATSWIAPFLLAREVQEALEEVRALALAFANFPAETSFDQSVAAFLEEARLEAARVLREREAGQPEPRPAGEEEVPF
ncbi:hypothetical protein KQ693_12790 (plasmid) [Thermus sp. PS18]|uniref:hypothetical protein n=1 Tax=Thermus sp. PS18 TaxID=2849039 RepID=UPI0022649FAF|nr:hypothetical protein [Thermus sp. PS18]UZX16828.1 hypothetical protein KQ693_12790 [Thermus sp. PS18]